MGKAAKARGDVQWRPEPIPDKDWVGSWLAGKVGAAEPFSMTRPIMVTVEFGSDEPPDDLFFDPSTLGPYDVRYHLTIGMNLDGTWSTDRKLVAIKRYSRRLVATEVLGEPPSA
jgi:hypothetical protein